MIIEFNLDYKIYKVVLILFILVLVEIKLKKLIFLNRWYVLECLFGIIFKKKIFKIFYFKSFCSVLIYC